MVDYSTRDNARLDALELADRILQAAVKERAFGHVQICFSNGVVTIVREERIHKISPTPPLKVAG
jgi:hypothetical protein